MSYIPENLRKFIEDKCKEKLLENLTWKDIAMAVQLYTDGSFVMSPDYFRKHWDPCTETWLSNQAHKTNEVCGQQSLIEEEDPVLTQLRKLKIEKIKISDERVQTNALLRRLAREETLKEIAKEASTEIAKNCPLAKITKLNTYNGPSSLEGILCISDWHYGINIDSPYNKYNPEIAKERINQLFTQVYNYCHLYDLETIKVVNLGDLIAGNIHLPIRLNSRIDIITQIIEVSEILAEQLQYLSTIVRIDYYDTLDNHSRIDPVKNNSIDLESLTRITNWYLKERLINNENITIHDNVFGDDIITFECVGHKVVGVHGHKDSPLKIVDNMALMTKQYYDLALTAHLHHFSADEKNECIVLSNGSVMGTDQYAQNLRLSAIPSQNFILVTEDNVINTIHRIVLK